MSVLTVHSVTDVRDQFRQFFDDVVRKSPQAIKKHQDVIIAMSQEQLAAMLDNLQFSLDYSVEEDGSCSGSISEVGISANAPSLAELKEKLAEHLLEYAQDYMAEFGRYSAAPNRKPHLPYIMKAILQPSLEALMEQFISCLPGKNSGTRMAVIMLNGKRLP